MKAVAQQDRARKIAVSLVLIVVLSTGGCGKKGDPLAPLRLVPGAVSELSVRQVGSEVQLKFVLPTANLNGPGRIDLERVEIFAMTAAPGFTPPNRELLTKSHVVGTIAVKPPPPPGEQTEPAVPDKRPGPGDRVSFVETLNADKLKPEPVKTAPEPATGRGQTPAAGQPAAETGAAPGATPAGAAPPTTTAPSTTPPGTTTQPVTTPPATTPPATTPAGTILPGTTAAPGVPGSTAPPPKPGEGEKTEAAATPEATAPAAAATYPTRVYALRGVSKGGRPGQPSARIVVPVVPPPPPPTGVDAKLAERAVILGWVPPVAEPGGPTIAFNVYRAASDPSPLNPAPLTTPSFEFPGIEFEKEQCFVVRAVEIVQQVSLESDPSAEKCVTPKDTFPPAVPGNLNAVSPPGSIQLTWDANTEPDLAGYKVLRADAPGDTLRPLTPELIRDASFSDPNIKPGASYEYAIVAVDRNGNASAPSQRLAVTAR
jgi:hypothetical protein